MPSRIPLADADDASARPAAFAPTSSPALRPAPARTAAADARVDLLGLSRDALRKTLAPHLDRPFRADQIYRALYRGGVDDFAAMPGLPAALRDRLREHFRFGLPRVVRLDRAQDGTVKALFRLDDGAVIEAVDIPDGRRRTLCVSSQAGCALACRFCVTGYWGAGRNLTPGEILAQVLVLRALAGDDPSQPVPTVTPADRPPIRPLPTDDDDSVRYNLVFMGMGEPLLNLESLRAALDVLIDHISWRRITVSTSGIVPGIDAMAAWERRPNLAVSLHAPDDARRDDLVPINRKYPLDDLIAALHRYPRAKRQRLMVEYILIDRINDAPADADLLARRLAGLHAKVNLIPLNPDPVLDDDMRVPSPARVEAFAGRLRDRGLVATVRRQRGDDVSAACGQLRMRHRDARGVRARARG
ncbi:MAG: 23S rRNA (adenine(2503)-C(2))-methyltransferase RlmN, partial [Acidobacteriota bacterium]